MKTNYENHCEIIVYSLRQMHSLSYPHRAHSFHSCTCTASAWGVKYMDETAPSPKAPTTPLEERNLSNWFRAGCRMLYKTQATAGTRIPNTTKPLESLSASVAISCAADAWGATIIVARAPRPAPATTALTPRILLNWFRPGCRILNSTQPIAGTKGRSSAIPLLSSAAKAINCCDAIAESGIVIAANIAPAVAFPTFLPPSVEHTKGSFPQKPWRGNSSQASWYKWHREIFRLITSQGSWSVKLSNTSFSFLDTFKVF